MESDSEGEGDQPAAFADLFCDINASIISSRSYNQLAYRLVQCKNLDTSKVCEIVKEDKKMDKNTAYENVGEELEGFDDTVGKPDPIAPLSSESGVHDNSMDLSW